MLRKVSSHGIGYSIADLSQVRYIFASAVPRVDGDLYQQVHDALSTIESVICGENCGDGCIVRQAVFLRDPAEYETCKRIMGEFYGDDLPATSYVVQPPCGGKLVEIEAWGVCRNGGDLDVERVSEHLVIVRHSGITSAHCAGIVPHTDDDAVYYRSFNAFQRMRDALLSRGFRYEQIIRTWLYLGDIVGVQDGVERYRELNRARADFYEGLCFTNSHVPPSVNGTVYPASTGIGASNRDVLMGCLALQTDRDDVAFLPLENPQQTSAFSYGKQHGTFSPKFSRAMAVIAGDTAAVLVSGTASIVNAETCHVGDVEAQTHQTLDNIQKLIAAPNFARYGFHGLGATLGDMALVRVYIKRREDYERTRAICESRLGELPAIYAVADVCRSDLLVEIEGIAFAHGG